MQAYEYSHYIFMMERTEELQHIISIGYTLKYTSVYMLCLKVCIVGKIIGLGD